MGGFGHQRQALARHARGGLADDWPGGAARGQLERAKEQAGAPAPEAEEPKGEPAPEEPEEAKAGVAKEEAPAEETASEEKAD